MPVTSNIDPESCNVFIQVWVDINALEPGQTAGVYVVDNQIALGSTNEGSIALNTVVSAGSRVCWSIVPIDPQYNVQGMLSFSSITASSGWQHIPAPYAAPGQKAGNPAIFTGVIDPSTTGGNLIEGMSCNYENGVASWSGNLPANITIAAVNGAQS